MKLLAFLKSKVQGYSSRHLKKLVEENCCFVNQRLQRFATYHLGTGDKVKLELPTSPALPEEEIPRILYEDADLLIYNKPSGIASDHPHFIKKIKKNLDYLQLVHRLDRDTTGALIFVKNEKAYNKMLDLFKKRVVKKSYLALVDGAVQQDRGVVDNYLGVIVRYQGQAKYGKCKDGLHAITEWALLKKCPQASLLRCFPKTGRTHQIRVHMSEMGHPILGDFHYSQTFRCQYRPQRHLLHAESVEFPRPGDDKIMRVEAPIPQDFEEAIKILFK